MAIYLNDRFLKNDEALLHVSDLSMQRGFAVFDFFRTENGIPLFIADHLDRFYTSAAAMHLHIKQNKPELTNIILELIEKSGMARAGIRVMLTGGYSADSYLPAAPNLLITCNPLNVLTDNDFEKGISVISYEHQREMPHIKSINYQMAVWLQPFLKEKKADDVLYFKNNIITEFPRSNVFIVTNENKLATPGRHILQGITRKNVLSLAKETMQVEECDITTEDLVNAKEIFLTSTTKKILPVLKVNEKIIGDGKPGKTTISLYQKFLELEESLAHLVNL
ncbi:MAG TPA: aminotransferase class IV [Chitinophagaceae bacterium]|nr:aminotransferase class IV [Chitinophagaceae bacterium]